MAAGNDDALREARAERTLPLVQGCVALLDPRAEAPGALDKLEHVVGRGGDRHVLEGKLLPLEEPPRDVLVEVVILAARALQALKRSPPAVFKLQCQLAEIVEMMSTAQVREAPRAP